jgi:putative ABC transport system substrate-binding protein
MFVVGGEAPIRAAMQATDKIPIIMTLAPDPVGSGFITSLARPGGNVTGMSALAPASGQLARCSSGCLPLRSGE